MARRPVNFDDLDDYRNPTLGKIKKVFRIFQAIVLWIWDILVMISNGIGRIFSGAHRTTVSLMDLFHPSNSGTVYGWVKVMFGAGCVAVWFFLSTLLWQVTTLGQNPSFVVAAVLTYMWYKISITYPFPGILIALGLYLKFSHVF